MRRIVILIPLVAILLACGLFTRADDPATQVGETPSPTPQVGEPPQIPPPTGGSPPTSPTTSYVPVIPFHGDRLVEEKIIERSVVVKATMTSFSSEVIVDTDSRHRAVLKFSLDVSEYLKGTGPSSIVAVWVDGRSYDTNDEANDAKAVILAERDDQWDGREAIIFLFDGANVFGPLRSTQLQLAGHYFLALGDRYSPDDRYSLHSRVNKIWLPAATSTSSTGDGQEFLLDVPPPPGSGSTAPTVTLGNLKTRITEVAAEINGGDGSEAYKECVRDRYKHEREARYFRQVKGIDSYADSDLNNNLMSGQPAGSVLDERNWYGTYPDIKAKTWLEGRDGALFSVVQGEPTPNDSSGDGVLTAGVDEIRYMESFLVVRPSPGGRV